MSRLSPSTAVADRRVTGRASFANILVHHRSYLLEVEMWLPLFLSLGFIVAVAGLVCVIARKRILLQQESRSYYHRTCAFHLILSSSLSQSLAFSLSLAKSDVLASNLTMLT